jgi:hypothetical protein
MGKCYSYKKKIQHHFILNNENNKIYYFKFTDTLEHIHNIPSENNLISKQNIYSNRNIIQYKNNQNIQQDHQYELNTKLNNDIKKIQIKLAERSEIPIIRKTEILNQIGFGGTSNVYKGIHDGNNVAVKKLKANKNNKHTKEFEREISILKKINHKFIISFIDAM